MVPRRQLYLAIISIKVSDSKFVEESIHHHLRNHRPSVRREFFKLTKEQAVDGLIGWLSQNQIDFKIDWSNSDKSFGIDQILNKHQIALGEEFEKLQKQIENKNLILHELIKAHDKKVAELKRFGNKPISESDDWTSKLALAYFPFPFGWLVWLGAFNVFSTRKETLGLCCVALLVAGFFAHKKDKENQQRFTLKIKPWDDLEQQIREINEKLSEVNREISNLEHRLNAIDTNSIHLKITPIVPERNHYEFRSSQYKLNQPILVNNFNYVASSKSQSLEPESVQSEEDAQLEIVKQTIDALGSIKSELKESLQNSEATSLLPEKSKSNRPFETVVLKGQEFKFSEFLEFANLMNLEVEDLRSIGRGLWVFRRKRLSVFYKDRAAVQLDELGFVWSNSRDGWFYL